MTALDLAERTRRNHRDVIGFFNRWLVLRGYLHKGTDWLEGVQNYSARKLGKITIYTAEEMRRLIAAADERILPMILIGGFAGLRHAEIARLEWQDIDLEEGFIEVKVENAKITIEGRNVDYEAVLGIIENSGGTIHSLDEVVAGSIIIDDANTLQD